MRLIALAANAEHGDVCDSCHRGRVERCASCSRERPGWRRDGRFLCQRCQPRPKRACALCGTVTETHAEWPLGPVCRDCYSRTLLHPDGCASCNALKVLTGTNQHGEPICGPCAGGRDYACITCSRPGDAYQNGHCARCVLRQRLTDSFGTPDRQLATLTTVLLESDRPLSVLKWLNEAQSFQLLHSIATHTAALTHDHLDQLRLSRTPPSARPWKAFSTTSARGCS
ncbi:MAG TPA: hypothetical protein VF062_02545 [Candidatus Limnocylindrales bacterium]